ncbi:MAG: alpha/beta fold hydrolase, partial [Actinomycetota bacterium]|nr:alpha/beta fold hydrolase [Actinomycetota bacterium]
MSEQQLSVGEIGAAGPRVVFLHGLFGQGKNFQAIARALEPRFRSLLVDLPNHGESGWTERVDYAEMADAVAARLRDELVEQGGAQA